MGGVDARVLVGEDADASAGAADDDAADLRGVGRRIGGGGGDLAGDGCGGGVVFVNAEVDDLGDGGCARRCATTASLSGWPKPSAAAKILKRRLAAMGLAGDVIRGERAAGATGPSE